MDTLTLKKHGLTKTITVFDFNSRQKKWFKNRDMNPYDYQDTTLTQTQVKIGDKLVWAISPNGGKTEMAICYIDLYLEDNPNHKVLVLTRNNSELRKQFFDRIQDKKPNFTCQMVTAENEVDFTKQVIVSLPSTLNKRKLPKFDLVVIDEAHHYYESEHTKENSQIKRIIERCGIKRELLLTGTPSYFIRQNQLKKKEIYKFIFVPMSKIYDAGNCSDVIVELATSSYFITDNDYRNDDIKDGYKFTKDKTYKTLYSVNEKLYERISSNFKNPKHFVNKKLLNPILNPIDWSVFKKGLGKGLIACRNQSQAKQTAKYYQDKGIDVALSISDTDFENKEIERFTNPNNKDCKILIVVNRGILGLSYNDFEFVVDLSMTKNIDKMYQLYCRATRKKEGVTKLFIKVAPSDREPHFRLRLTGMLCLMHEEWFSKFNGKNFDELEVPTKMKKTGGRSGGGSNGGTNRPKKEPYPVLGLPTMELLKDLYTKRDELYSPVCWSTVGTILRDLNIEVGKRGNLTVEVIEDWYKQFENKSLKEMNESGNKHISGKARELGIHNNLIKKYNIKQDKYFGDKDYSVLLICKNRTEAQEKYNAELQSLWKTKDDELIQQYTNHFEKLRERSYSKEMLNTFFDLLPNDEYPNDQRGNREFNGKYRAIFTRGKDEWYDKILNKWGNKVPMLFLKDEDKLKRIEKEIKTSKDYTDWYKKFASKHKRILERLDRLDLLKSLKRQRQRNETNTN
jgi:superfamily II DNA or RNA helicase